MHVRRGAVLIAWSALAALAVQRAGAQQAPVAPPPASRSARTGVYSAAQAQRGQERYALMCQSCHTPASQASPAFVNAWNGRTLLALFAYIELSMPMSDPGVLTPEECAELVAYLLKLNGFPPGPTDLSTNPDTLRGVRFDVATTPGGNPLPLR